MTITGSTRTTLLLAGLLLFVGQSGCAFTRHEPPDSVRAVDQLGTIGVMPIRNLKETRLYLPETAQERRAAGTAMAQGFVSGFVEGFSCGLHFFICSPTFAVIYGTAGGVYDWISEAWVKRTSEADSASRNTLADLNLDEVVPDHLIFYGREQGFPMIPLPSQPVLAPIELSAYRHLEEQGISTVLQMSGLTVELKAIDNSRRQLVMSVGISLIRTADGNVLRELMVIGERLITDDQGAMSLATWAEHDAATFRAEIDQALHRLAEQIVEELAVDRTLLSVQADSSIRIEDLPKPVQNVMDTIRNVGNRVGDEIPKATSAVIGAINKVVKSDPVSKDQL